MRFATIYWLSAFLVVGLALPNAVLAGCSSSLFVSDYLADQVRVYDGCTGDHVRDLDNGGRINGPQAIRLGPDGRLYVVSEENARILRYDPETLAFIDIFVQDDPGTADNELNGLRRPTGLDFDSNGDLYVGGFQSNTVHRYSGVDGRFVDVFVGNTGLLNGPDGGLMFGPDGTLYVPNFDGDSISMFDAQGQHEGDITAPGIMREPRVLVLSPDQSSLLVSSYANGRVISIPLDDVASAQSIGPGFASLSGMALLQGDLLITGDRLPQIDRRDPTTGESQGTLVARGAGGLDRPTFIFVYEKGREQAQIVNEQFWMVGLGTVSGATLRIDSLKATRGAVFGEGFDPSAVVRDDWGWFEMELSGCSDGEVRYGARASDFGGFGDGGYAVVRIAPNAAQRACEDAGFDPHIAPDWLAGSWFGGSNRSGEGFFVDALEDGQVFLSWFTYGALQ